MIYPFFKRLFDIIISLIALPFILLVIIIFAPIIYFTDKGNIFYVAERMGRSGKSFKMLKLRSMYLNAPDIRLADGSTFNSDDDARVTPIGKFMRKTSIDELPQILNVLIGDMSFVGPRPHLTTNYDGIDWNDPYNRRRLDVRPGITGYSQAFFRNSISGEKKFENDIYYVDNMSFILDIKILVKTAVSVLKNENIYAVSEGTTAETTTVSEAVAEAETVEETAAQ